MSKQTLQISVRIAGGTYSLTVTPDEEQMIREIETQINEEYNDLMMRYGSKLAKHDILAMLLLMFAQRLHTATKNADVTAVQGKLSDILLRLDNALQK